jgi:hypothetical protein
MRCARCGILIGGEIEPTGYEVKEYILCEFCFINHNEPPHKDWEQKIEVGEVKHD